MTGPRIRKSGNKLIVTHDQPVRIYSSHVYPNTSENGSTIVVSGTDAGLHIAWHGGKPLYFTSSTEGPAVNGSRGQDLLDGDYDLTEPAESDDEALFDSDEEDLDEDQPCPPIIQTLDIPFPSPVLQIAIPRQPDLITSASSSVFARSIVIALACFDGTLRLLTLPLDPPSAATKRKRKLGVRQCLLADDSSTNSTGFALPHALDVAAETIMEGEERTHQLIVACALSSNVALYRVPCIRHHDDEDETIDTKTVIPFTVLHPESLVSALRFNRFHAETLQDLQLAIAQDDGVLQILSMDTITATASPHRTFTAGFEASSHDNNASGGITYRKGILDAVWVHNGSAVAALLEDGEWGVWVVDESQTKLPSTNSASNPAGFAMRGFIGQAPETTAVGELKSKSKPQIAPVTPNTKRVRQENLFKGPAVQSGIAARGGLSVTTSSTSQFSSSTDDALLLWYGSDVHTVPSLKTLWSRSAANSGKNTGTLYGPGVSRIEGFNLSGETINSVRQLAVRQTPTSAGLGSLNQRDVLITTEHRFILVTTARPTIPTRTTDVDDTNGLDSPLNKRDQMLLTQGDLDLGGVDRLLDEMVGLESTPMQLGAKRVGFTA